jgi:hydroxymethylpyrimidine pyrophosphatase-like HAD family hydrolase
MATLNRPLVLALTLDETFANADSKDRDALLDVMDSSPDKLRLIYMSHESAQTLIQLAARAELPVPEMFLADTGTTALKGDGAATIEPLQRNIVQLWPGKETVTRLLNPVPGLKLLEDDAPCRQAIEFENDEAQEAARQKIDGIGCHMSLRGGNRADVLPFGVDLGSSLGRWFVQENISPAHALAFGETLGDLSLFGRGWKGAVFAHAPDELKREAGQYHNVQIAKADGPAGVLSVLRFFGWLELSGVA